MRAAIFVEPRKIEVAERPDPVVTAPTDAVVRVLLACVCGSDLWYFRGRLASTPVRSATSSWACAPPAVLGRPVKAGPRVKR